MAYDYLVLFQDPGPRSKVQMLSFDALTGTFTASNVIYQTVDGVTAYATIDAVYISGTTGELALSNIFGTFQDDKIIYEASYGSELLDNIGFETAGAGGADVFSYWTEGASDGAIADEGSLVHAGSHACKLTQGASLATQIYSTYQAGVENSFFILTFWTRGDGTYAGRYDLSSDALGNTSTGVTGATYTQVTVVFQQIAAGIVLYLKPWTVNGAIAYFDDISLKQITNAALANGTVREIYLEGWRNT